MLGRSADLAAVEPHVDPHVAPGPPVLVHVRVEIDLRPHRHPAAQAQADEALAAAQDEERARRGHRRLGVAVLVDREGVAPVAHTVRAGEAPHELPALPAEALREVAAVEPDPRARSRPRWAEMPTWTGVPMKIEAFAFGGAFSAEIGPT